MWQLQTEVNNRRTYTNNQTGSNCTTSKVYTDKEGNDWWSFDDLMSIPYVRSFAATKVSSLYALGLSVDDGKAFFTKHKATLKAKDNGEKFEIAYAETLDFESKFTMATDPVKQMSSLVPVYFTMNDEDIASFENNLQIKKMSILEADPNMHNFFLNKQIPLIEAYMERLKLISVIASASTEDLPVLLQ